MARLHLTYYSKHDNTAIVDLVWGVAVRWGALVSPFVKQKHNCKESTLKNLNFNLQTFTSQNLEIPDLWVYMQLSIFPVQSMY